MKKILLAIALVMIIGLSAEAQSDGFFSYYENGYNDRMVDPNNGSLALPNTALGDGQNSNAPLGTGLLIFTALGTGYAVARRNKR